MGKTKILIVDDHRVVIEGIKSALNDHQKFVVAGEATGGLEAIELTKSIKPDIIIMDISMPDLDGIQTTKRIKEIKPETGIVIYSMHSNKEFIIELFKVGISAYVLKEDPLTDLILALESVMAGGTYFSTMAPTVLLRHIEELEKINHDEYPFNTLSRREREVFILLADGKRINEIANMLFISSKTVETHKYHIMEKLDVSSIVELTKMAIRKNLVEH
jgi:DNA-binding NarL/FixJ family response regulator